MARPGRGRQVTWEGELIKGTGWASTRQLSCLEVTQEDPSMRTGREEAGQMRGRRLGPWKVCIRIPGSTRGTPKVKA